MLTSPTMQVTFLAGLLAGEHPWSLANDMFELKVIGICIYGNGDYATKEIAIQTFMRLLQALLPEIDVTVHKSFAKERTPRRLAELQLLLRIKPATALHQIVAQLYKKGAILPNTLLNLKVRVHQPYSSTYIHKMPCTPTPEIPVS
jgi:hypothetical protein